MASSMAFFCADDPSALRSPVKQSAAAAALVGSPAAVLPSDGAGFSVAQAESVRTPVRARAPKALTRETDTG